MFPSGFSACGIQVAIETATSPSGQSITVNLYSAAAGVFPSGATTLVGTTSTSVADQSGTILNVPLTGVVPAGSDLIVEVFTPDGRTLNNSFFIGSNAGASTAPSYIRAPDCGIATPTAVSSVGFPNMNILLNVDGTFGTSPAAVMPVPTLSEWALLMAIIMVGGVALQVLRNRKV